MELDEPILMIRRLMIHRKIIARYVKDLKADI